MNNIWSSEKSFEHKPRANEVSVKQWCIWGYLHLCNTRWAGRYSEGGITRRTDLQGRSHEGRGCE